MTKAAISFLIIPVLGFLASFYWLGLDVAENISARNICLMSDFEVRSTFSNPNEVKSYCNNHVGPLLILQKSSIISFLISFGVLILFKATSSYCGTDRDRNANLFPKLIPITVLIIGGQVLVQGLILAFLSFKLIGGSFITLLIGGGAAIGFFQVITSLSSFFRKPLHIERAILADKQDFPDLWEHVENIAQKIQARKPDNIILGLEPTFYAISTNVKLIGGITDKTSSRLSEKMINGETLFLSLPLMRLFTMQELDGVIGHELGHFKAADTTYSSKFAPVYANLGKSIENLGNSENIITLIAKLPALFVLDAMYESFATNTGSISREREFEADRVGCQAASKEAMAYSLAKVVTYSSLWQQTVIENINRLNNGKITSNLSEVFRDSSSYNIGKRDIADIVKDVLPSIIQHPTDTHPPVSERYESLGFNIKNIERDKILIQGNASKELIKDIKVLEESLTNNEHNFCLVAGWAVLPEQTNESSIANIIYSMAAAMIGADGKIENDEVRVAEGLGAELVEGFDRVDFRDYVNNLDKIPDFQKTAEACAEFDTEAKLRIYYFLKSIAEADDDFDEDEEKLLNILQDIWSLNIE